LEINGQRRDGKVVQTRVITRPRITADGKLIWDGVLIDITERVEAQAAAERELASRIRAEQELRLLNETLEQRVVEEVPGDPRRRMPFSKRKRWRRSGS
jgi:hypothetical protein